MNNPNYVMREYDDALRNILYDGFDIDGDRTGVGTRCLFGINTEYDISTRIPVLTKRKAYWQSIVKEVLWYISGSSNIGELESTGCKIWTPWISEDFTTKHKLPNKSGGYLYGFNLIHFGADLHQHIERYEYAKANPNVDSVTLNTLFPNSIGFNQLDYVIDTLRKNPKSRQACFTFWRPDTNHQAILPACHAFYSFIVSPNAAGEMKVLNCSIFQRSADYAIGVGMGNLFTATLFTYMIAQQLGFDVGKVYHTASHAHIYHNAIDATNEYLSRVDEPNSPILKLNYKPSIYDYTIDDFELIDYNPLGFIKFPIAV